MHVIVLSPCLHTIRHGRSLLTLWSRSNVRSCLADNCTGFFDMTLIWNRVTHPLFRSRMTEERFSIRRPIQTRWDAALSPGCT